MAPRVIDLSLPLSDGMRGVALEPNSTIADRGYNTTNAHFYSHAGTHMDAPRHFLDEGGSIVFLKRLEPGPSSNSYGIHVAEVAGLPSHVVNRGAEILQSLVDRERHADAGANAPASPPAEASRTASRVPEPGLFGPEELIAQEIRSLRVEELRPLDALAMLDRWKSELAEPDSQAP